MGENKKTLLLFLLGIILSFAVTNPYSRETLLHLKNPHERKVLATLDYSVDEDHYKIIKLGVGSNIAIEIYKLAKETGQPTIQNMFSIPFSRDTFFTNDNDKTLSNLFLSNLDQDDNNEIIVPVLDENLVSHLTIIKYNSGSRSFSFHDHIAN
ncbi:MAG: hypothetical protein H6623_08700 [Bdellovibrionaceae bacterium]|nr:hypothetical protein [Pseudobdellovibrionaceae bacterium]